MKIQFDIKEKLSDIVSEILHSGKWQSVIEVDNEKLKKIVMTDLFSGTKAFVEIWEKEIHIKTHQEAHTYRIFTNGNVSVCEYIGAHDGLLKQNLLPRITPLSTIQCLCEEGHCNIQTHQMYTPKRYTLKDEYIMDWGPIPSYRG